MAEIRDAGVFESVGATWIGAGDLLVNHGGIADSLSPAFVTHDVLPRLGVLLQAGRAFSAEDDRRGAAPVVLLSDRAWRQIFAADPRIVGRTVRLGASAATIVGIVAPGFRGLTLGSSPDAFVPLHAIAEVSGAPLNYFAETNHVSSPTAGVRIIGRLRNGSTPAQAAARVDSLQTAAPGLERTHTQRLGLTPLDVAARTGATKAGLVTFARLLAVTVSLTLLVGCGTVLLLMGSARPCCSPGSSSVPWPSSRDPCLPWSSGRRYVPSAEPSASTSRARCGSCKTSPGQPGTQVAIGLGGDPVPCRPQRTSGPRPRRTPHSALTMTRLSSSRRQAGSSALRQHFPDR